MAKARDPGLLDDVLALIRCDEGRVSQTPQGGVQLTDARGLAWGGFGHPGNRFAGLGAPVEGRAKRHGEGPPRRFLVGQRTNTSTLGVTPACVASGVTSSS